MLVTAGGGNHAVWHTEFPNEAVILAVPSKASDCFIWPGPTGQLLVARLLDRNQSFSSVLMCEKQDPLHNLWDPMKSENAGTPSQNLLRIFRC